MKFIVKKALFILIGLFVLLAAVIFFYILSLGAPFDPEKSPYINMEQPKNLERTIYNAGAGHSTTFLRKSHETNGEYSLLEIELAPGGENGPHYHNSFSETFIGLEGSTSVYINGEIHNLNAGESAKAEMGDIHYFFNDSDETVRFQVKIEPGSPGFEKSLYILYGLINDGLIDESGAPEDISHTAVFAVYSDTRTTGALSILNPIFSRLAGKAQREGVESELIETYYLSMIKENESSESEEEPAE